MSNNDVCIMLKIPTIFLEMIICWTTDSSTFSVLPFFTYQLSVSCHLLKRHSNQCEIYREVTVYTSCTCVLNQSLFITYYTVSCIIHPWDRLCHRVFLKRYWLIKVKLILTDLFISAQLEALEARTLNHT